MAKSWMVLKDNLEEETKKISLTCPDEIKRLHYGIITHSEAGKYALNQYFGHWVHLYASYYEFNDVLGLILHLAEDPQIELEDLKKVFNLAARARRITVKYGGQKSLGKAINEMVETLDTLHTKEEFLHVLKAFIAYVGRLYWWVHWYFPWGIGPVLCKRLTPDDLKEIVRLSTTT